MRAPTCLIVFFVVQVHCILKRIKRLLSDLAVDCTQDVGFDIFEELPSHALVIGGGSQDVARSLVSDQLHVLPIIVGR